MKGEAGVRQAVRARTDHVDVGNQRRKVGLQTVAQGAKAGALPGFRRNRPGRRTEAGDSREVLGAGATPALLATAPHQWGKRDGLRGRDDGADARGATDLVAGDEERVAAKRRHRQRDLAERLNRIHHQRRAMGTAERGNLGHGLDDAGLVVGGHERDKRRTAIGEKRTEPSEVDDTRFGHRAHRHRLGREAATGQHAGMFNGRNDEARERPLGAIPEKSGDSTVAAASLPPEVKVTQRGSAPTRTATDCRASSIIRRAARPRHGPPTHCPPPS